jgi:hypothetical protein
MYYSFRSGAWEVLGGETTRVITLIGGPVARAVQRRRHQKNSRMYGTFETVTR